MAYGDGYGGSKPAPTTKPKPSGGSTGGGSYGSGYGGGSSGGKGSTGQPSALKPQFISKVRDAIGAGDTKTVKRLAKQANLSPRNIKGLMHVTSQFGPDTSFGGRFAQDVTGTLTGLPRGLVGLGKAGVTEAVAPVRVAYKGITGQHVGLNEAIGSIPIAGQAYGVGRGLVEQKPDTSNPLSSSIGASFRRTANRVSDPQEALKQYSAHPFNTAVEDVGNVGIALGGASRIARVGGLEKTANVLETGSRTLAKVGNAPFLPVSPLARGANKLIKAGEAAAGRSTRVHNLMADLHISPAAKFAKNEGYARVQASGQEMNRLVREYVKPVLHLLPHKHQQEAAAAVSQQYAKTLATVRATDPAGFDAWVKANQGDLNGISVKGAHLAADYVEGKAGRLATKIDQAVPIMQREAAGRQAGAVSRGELNPEQLGTETLSGPVAAAVAPHEARLPRLRKEAAVASMRAEKAAQVVADIKTAATGRLARQREMTTIGEFGLPLQQTRRAEGDIGGAITSKDINAERAVSRTAASEAAKTARAQRTADMLATQARAADRRVRLTEVESARARAAAESSLAASPARYRPAQSVERAAASHLTGVENSLRGQGLHAQAAAVGKVAGELHTSLRSLVDAGVDPPHYIRTVAREKGVRMGAPQGTRRMRPGATRQRTGAGKETTGVVEQARASAARAKIVIQNEMVAHIEASPYARKAGEFVGQDARMLQQGPSVKQLTDQGYTPLNVTPGMTHVPVDTVVVPTEMKDILDRYNKPAGPLEKTMERLYDPATRAFKASVLPLSPSWQVGNAIGNTFAATFVAGVGPADYLHRMVQTLAEYKRTGHFPGGERLQAHGATYEAQQVLKEGQVGVRNPGGRIRQGLHAISPIARGYQLNEFVDNLNRSIVYLSKTGKGYSHEMALAQSLRALGDFTKMSPFEQQVVRRAIPFYAWQRHLTKLAATLPIEHPLRTALILDLANQFQTKEDWESLLPKYQQGSIPLPGGLGGGYVQTSNLFPFSNPVDWLTNPQGALSNINPILKGGLENLTGENTFTQRPFTRPPGTGRFNEAGQPLPTAPSLLEQIKKLSPQVRFYRDISGHNDVVRYEDGSPVLLRDPKTGKQVTIPGNKTDMKAVLSRLGFNIKSKKDLQSFVDSIILRKVENWKSAHPTKVVK